MPMALEEIAAHLRAFKETPQLQGQTIILDKENPKNVDLFQAFLDNPTKVRKKVMLYAHPDKNPGITLDYMYAIDDYCALETEKQRLEVKAQINQTPQAAEAPTTPNPTASKPTAATFTTSKPDTAPTPPQPTPSNPNFTEAFKNVGAAAAQGQTNGTSVPTPTSTQPHVITTQYTKLYQSPSTYSGLSSNDLRLDLHITVESLANLVNAYIKTGRLSATLGIIGPLPTTPEALTRAAKIIAQALKSLQANRVQVTIAEPLLTTLRANANTNKACKDLVKQYDEPLLQQATSRPRAP